MCWVFMSWTYLCCLITTSQEGLGWSVPAMCLIFNSSLHLLHFWKWMILPIYCMKTRTTPKRAQGHTLYKPCQLWGWQKQRENSLQEDSGILSMAVLNEWDGFPVSSLVMLSLFLVNLKLTQTWLQSSISVTVTAYVYTLLAFVEHGLYHCQPRN